MTIAAAIQSHRWTLREYEDMVSGGVFHPEARLELLDGEIYDMSPQTSRHATAIRLIEDALRAIFGRGFDVRAQLPAAFGPDSQPEPDVAVVEGSPRDYSARHPTTAVLVVEVSDSSLAYDRTQKLATYADCGIPEYWIVNLVAGCLEVHRDPGTGTYRDVFEVGRDAGVEPLAKPGDRIAVRDLLP